LARPFDTVMERRVMWWICISRRKRLPQGLDLILSVLPGNLITVVVRSNPADAAAALVLFPSLL
jgi:hypothetical protein